MAPLRHCYEGEQTREWAVAREVHRGKTGVLRERENSLLAMLMAESTERMWSDTASFLLRSENPDGLPPGDRVRQLASTQGQSF